MPGLTSLILLLAMPVCSVLPQVILHIAASNILRRAHGRIALWAVVGVMVSVHLIRSLVVVYTGQDYTNFDRYRLEGESIRTVRPTYIIFAAWAIDRSLCIGINLFVISSIVSTIRCRSTISVRSVHILCGIIAVSSLSAMWAFILWVLYFTAVIRGSFGKVNKDNEWSFRQVLALATWVPFVIEFAYTWWQEPGEALSGRLMAPYEAVKVLGNTGAIELHQAGEEEARGQSERLL
jgi:hypothetical protein